MKKRSLFILGLLATSLLVGGVLVGCNQANDANDSTDTTDNTDTIDTTDNADNTDSTDNADTTDTTTATTYNIAFSETNEVVATLSETEATAGTKIDITIVSVPNDYVITSITSDVSDLVITVESETVYTFNMPESDVNLTINVSEVMYQLTIDADEANGGYYTLTYNDEGEDNYGEEVTDLSTISFGTALRIVFYNFNSANVKSVEKSVTDISWTKINNLYPNEFTFVMPNQNLTLKSNWSFPSSSGYDFLYVNIEGAPSGITLRLEVDASDRVISYDNDSNLYYFRFTAGVLEHFTIFLNDSNSSLDKYEIAITCDIEGLILRPTILSSTVYVLLEYLYTTVSLTFTFNELS